MKWLVIGIVIKTENEVIGILRGKSDPKYYWDIYTNWYKSHSVIVFF